MGVFTETGCSDFKGNEKSVQPAKHGCFSISSHRSFVLIFFLLIISVIFPLLNFLLGKNLMDKWKSIGVWIFLVTNVQI